ncbi:hypothetical protein [Nitrosospira sp. NpAV]|uniref:hypothetical protein n=1 Tax=Nitrosospira sp. NpAV TaxID=58133 RepID=UPI0005A1CCCB|nr:hypothetical protein [Nitrosospira sp. NpAV]KIO49448.1 hypothetical protein SQ11_07170 [Nitrosospira sp. NpAV]
MNVASSKNLGKAWPWAVILIFFAFSFLSAVLVGTGQFLLAGALFVFIALATVSLLFMSTQGIADRRGFLLIVVWCVMLFTNGMQQSGGVPVGYVLELLTFGLVLASAQCVSKLAGQDGVLRVLLILLACHFAVALLSSMLGRSHTFAALWQLQYNLKWPLMFAVGTMLIWNERVDDLMRKIILWSWVLIAPILALEITMPGVHSQVFGVNPDGQVNPFFGVGARYRGPFNHAGYLAIISALLVTGAMAQLISGRGRSWGWIALIYTVFVLLSGQRQELFAMAFALLLFAVIVWRQYLHLLLLITSLLGGLLVTSFVYFDYIPMQSTLAEWGLLDDFLSHRSERAIITDHGIDIARQFFPLGSGLGTYGGPGAQKFDLSLFWELGFGRYWWFLQGKFILDTYWPNIMAESGFIGAAFLMIFFAVLWVTLLRRAWRSVGTSDYRAALLALAALTLLLANTPSSPMLTDPRGAFIFWLIIGSAWRSTMPKYSKRRLDRAYAAPARDASTRMEAAI